MNILYDQTSFSLFFILLRNFLLIVFNVFSCQHFDISSFLLFSKLALFAFIMHSSSVTHRLQRFALLLKAFARAIVDHSIL